MQLPRENSHIFTTRARTHTRVDIVQRRSVIMESTSIELAVSGLLARPNRVTIQRKTRGGERKMDMEVELTSGCLHQVLDFLDEPLDLLAGAVELLFVLVQVLAEPRTVREAVGELQRHQHHAHLRDFALRIGSGKAKLIKHAQTRRQLDSN